MLFRSVSQSRYEGVKKKHPGRNALPEHIPVEEIILEPEGLTPDMIHIGDVITETLDYKPPVLLKRRYIRRKYAVKNPVEDATGNTVIADLPSRPLPKAIAEASLLAYLWSSKFVDHLPFYRQIEMFRRQFGWELHKATLNDWFSACCTLLQPLYECHSKQVFETDYLQIDESPIKVLEDNKPESSHQGFMWVADTVESSVRNRSRVRWSHPLQPEDWASADYFDIDPDDESDQITALVPFRDMLLVFKQVFVKLNGDFLYITAFALMCFPNMWQVGAHQHQFCCVYHFNMIANDAFGSLCI